MDQQELNNLLQIKAEAYDLSKQLGMTQAILSEIATTLGFTGSVQYQEVIDKVKELVK